MKTKPLYSSILVTVHYVLRTRCLLLFNYSSVNFTLLSHEIGE